MGADLSQSSIPRSRDTLGKTYAIGWNGRVPTQTGRSTTRSAFSVRMRPRSVVLHPTDSHTPAFTKGLPSKDTKSSRPSNTGAVA
ncbi:hypothetical protein CLOM_g13023 [Closterium sp. NIES-68]|nr:hypothetical protein CLOM_g4973 [Closterium sp. NIES-68]GJP53899.1 hypothetical protein CLOM_g13023 [Closterium sp. NIES-68]GJP61984.1 hypothetical protein CLOP_g19096 [Closterium sp. NIES-67]